MNHNNSIKNMVSKINDDSSICVVGMYFKMKFETMKHCKNKVDSFVKRFIL